MQDLDFVKTSSFPDGPLISIALCTYNGAEFLKQQIDSILNQTYKNINLVIVDDHSTDDTVHILSEFYYDNRFQVFLNDKNIGASRCYEMCISLCKGDLIALSDQDDIWEIDKLKYMVSGLEDNILLYHDSQMFATDNGDFDAKMSDFYHFVKGKCSLSFIFKNCVSGHSMIFRSELREFLVPTPDGIYHDAWIAFIASTVGKINYLPQILVRYRQHSKSVTQLEKSHIDMQVVSIETITNQLKLKYTRNLKLFMTYPGINAANRQLFQTIYNRYLQREKQVYSIGLVYLLLHHLRIFDIDDSTLLKKITHAFREGFNPATKAGFKYHKKALSRKFYSIFHLPCEDLL